MKIEGELRETVEAPWEDRRFDDLLLHARLRVHNPAVVDYEVRTLTVHDDGVGDPLKFDTEGDPTLDPDAAKPFIKGYIKWDGCSNNEFPASYHGCQREHLTRLGPLFDRLFDWAAEKIGDGNRYLSRGNL